jgi:2-polyprenyl-3-methyl-5-hydroxy-6-metoxy-1,4-benzoquinol methylase
MSQIRALRPAKRVDSQRGALAWQLHGSGEVNRVRLVSLLLPILSFTAVSQSIPDEEQVWKEFLSWFKQQPQTLLPVDSGKAYERHLAAIRAPQADAARRTAVVNRLLGQRLEARQLFFDKVYSGPQSWFVEKPNELLARAVEGTKPGRALDVAMGQGRNAVFLAANGWDVTGFDIAEEGLKAARASADKLGVKLNLVRAETGAFDFGTAQWDLVVMTYAFAPVGEPGFMSRLWKSLKPGGLVVFEVAGGGPANELLKVFRDYRVLHYEDKDGAAEWGQGARKAHVLKLVAEKM